MLNGLKIRTQLNLKVPFSGDGLRCDALCSFFSGRGGEGHIMEFTFKNIHPIF